MIRRLYPLAFVALLAGLGSIACSDSVVDGTNVTHTTAAGRTLSATYLRPNVSSVVPTLILLHQPGPSYTTRLSWKTYSPRRGSPWIEGRQRGANPRVSGRWPQACRAARSGSPRPGSAPTTAWRGRGL